MYKVLFFLHKTEDDQLLKHFKNFTLKYLTEITGKEVRLAKVESNLLLDEKYSYFCEIETNTKDEMDKLMNSKAGKLLNKDLMTFHDLITVISVNYTEDK